MSEVYKFKSMSQVDVLEEPADGTTLLAVENGAVKQIPVAKLGGGGGGYMVRTVLDVETMSISSADKTYAEILAAVDEGCAPVLRVDMPMGEDLAFALLPMAAMQPGVLLFLSAQPGGAMQVMCSSENEWTLLTGDEEE